MLKKIIFFLMLTFFITSCADTFDSVKRGLTGAKANSTDEFLVKKKDPLTMPPKWDDLPVPGQGMYIEKEVEEVVDIEELLQLGKDQESAKNIKQGGSAEELVLRQLKQK